MTTNTPDPDEVKKILAGFGVDVDETPAAKEEPAKKPERPEDDPDHPSYDPMSALDISTHESVLEIAGDLLGEHDEEEHPPLRRDGEGPATELARSRPAIQDRWTRNIPNLGVVGVTDEEKRVFENSFLHDDRIELPITFKLTVDRSMTVVCRTVYTHEREVIACAVQRLVEEHPMATMATMAVASEFAIRANALVQVVSVGDKKWPAFDLRRRDGEQPAHHPDMDKLVTAARGHFENLQGRHFALISRALHIFEVKMTILEDALANQDFTLPADSD